MNFMSKLYGKSSKNIVSLKGTYICNILITQTERMFFNEHSVCMLPLLQHAKSCESSVFKTFIENVFGVPLSAIGLFPLTAKNECLVIRYAVTTVLQKFSPRLVE